MNIVEERRTADVNTRTCVDKSNYVILCGAVTVFVGMKKIESGYAVDLCSSHHSRYNHAVELSISHHCRKASGC